MKFIPENLGKDTVKKHHGTSSKLSSSFTTLSFGVGYTATCSSIHSTSFNFASPRDQTVVMEGGKYSTISILGVLLYKR